MNPVDHPLGVAKVRPQAADTLCPHGANPKAAHAKRTKSPTT
jgi:ribosomal protein L2